MRAPIWKQIFWLVQLAGLIWGACLTPHLLYHVSVSAPFFVSMWPSHPIHTIDDTRSLSPFSPLFFLLHSFIHIPHLLFPPNCSSYLGYFLLAASLFLWLGQRKALCLLPIVQPIVPCHCLCLGLTSFQLGRGDERRRREGGGIFMHVFVSFVSFLSFLLNAFCTEERDK